MTARLAVSFGLALAMGSVPLGLPALACESCPQSPVRSAEATASGEVSGFPALVPPDWHLPLVHPPDVLPDEPIEGQDELQVRIEADISRRVMRRGRSWPWGT